jgi:hypothetical protein
VLRSIVEDPEHIVHQEPENFNEVLAALEALSSNVDETQA